MARVRCITEMGMGVDLHGRDATKAAKRAVSDAIRHSSLGFTECWARPPTTCSSMSDRVPGPKRRRHRRVAKELPYGKVTVTAVKGGLRFRPRAAVTPSSSPTPRWL